MYRAVLCTKDPTLTENIKNLASLVQHEIYTITSLSDLVNLFSEIDLNYAIIDFNCDKEDPSIVLDIIRENISNAPIIGITNNCNDEQRKDLLNMGVHYLKEKKQVINNDSFTTTLQQVQKKCKASI